MVIKYQFKVYLLKYFFNIKDEESSEEESLDDGMWSQGSWSDWGSQSSTKEKVFSINIIDILEKKGRI